MPRDSPAISPSADLLVFSLGEVPRDCVFRPDAVLSLLSPGKEVPRFDSTQLVLRMEDVENDGPGSPTTAHATLIAVFLAAAAQCLHGPRRAA